MANKTQVRLQQVTGSVLDMQPAAVAASGLPGTNIGVAHTNMNDIMAYYANAIRNIHGKRDFGSQTPGLFTHPNDVKFDVTGSDQPGYAGNRSLTLALDRFQSGGSGEEVKLQLKQASGNGLEQIVGTNSSGTGDGDSSHQAAVQFNATAGGIGLQWGASQKLYGDGGKIELKAEGNYSQALQIKATAATAEDGILVDALNGGVKLVAGRAAAVGEGSVGMEASHANGRVMFKAGSSTKHTEQLVVSASHVDVHGGAKLRANLNQSATSTTDAPIISAGGIALAQNLHAGSEVRSDASTSAFRGSANGAYLRLGASNEFRIQHVDATLSKISGSAMVQVTGSNGLHLTAEGVMGGMILSASQGIGFSVDGGFGFGAGTQGTLMFAQNGTGEGALYRSRFSATTSVVSALNELRGLISNTTATIFRTVLTSDQGSVGAAQGITFVQGDYTPTEATWLGKKQNEVDVYVNGQLMMSGSEGDRAAGNVDYNLNWDSSAPAIKFSYKLLKDDIVTVYDRS